MATMSIVKSATYEDMTIYELQLDGVQEVDICYHHEKGYYTAYDGVDEYGRHEDVGKAAIAYMKQVYGENVFGEGR